MKSRTIFGSLAMMFLMVQAGNTAGKNDIQKYFNDTAVKVKATVNPGEKREILTESLQTMSKALGKVESLGLISQEDRADIGRFKTALQEKQDELAGVNGYEQVSDSRLNAFSDYVVQDMEQADRMISISLVTALLIVIIIILIV